MVTEESAMIEGRKLAIALLLGLACLVAGCGDDDDDSGRVAFVPNSPAFWADPENWPTSYGPAYADVVTLDSQFLPCEGGPYALCYYSGPEPASCVPTADGEFADCRCFEIAYGPYFVLMTAILNYDVYQETVAVCGADGSNCSGQANKAPVCAAINEGKLIPGADVISTFSFTCVAEEGIGQTPCAAAPYAGCMTAPCWRTAEQGIVTCQCPIFDGPFQVGNFGAQCSLPSDLVWSAAYNPNEGGGTFPQPPTCVPDAPGEIGCPLLDSSTVLPPGTDCQAVCEEYADCTGTGGVQRGYTCDATLCTAGCNDRDLVDLACAGLTQCDTDAIIALEQSAGCSCCASQLCGCQPNAATNAAIRALVAAQAERGIESQCAVNGTLCGQ
jgi:hypothetical protein